MWNHMTDFLVTAAFTFVRRGEQVELYHEHGLEVLLLVTSLNNSVRRPVSILPLVYQAA